MTSIGKETQKRSRTGTFFLSSTLVSHHMKRNDYFKSEAQSNLSSKFHLCRISKTTKKKKKKKFFNPTLSSKTRRHLYLQISIKNKKALSLSLLFINTNFYELLHTPSIASNLYTVTSKEIINRSQKLC